jgi:hypothetical protein
MLDLSKVVNVPTIASAPASPVSGQMYFDTSAQKLYLYNGSAWVQVYPDSGTTVTTVTTVEVDLGSMAKSGRFDITGLSGLTPGAQIVMQQAAGPYTGKGTLADESQMDAITVTAYAFSATVIRAYWTSRTWVHGNFKFNYIG